MMIQLSDTLISDFSNPLFQDAFRQYFSELDIHVADWESLFREMNEESDTLSYVRTTETGEIIGFILFQPTKFTSWFFEETYGFIREFWVSGAYRNAGHGTALIRLAEKYFYDNDIFTCILTSDTAERFYEKHGYRRE